MPCESTARGEWQAPPLACTCTASLLHCACFFRLRLFDLLCIVPVFDH